MEKLDQSSMKEELSKLHSNYYGAKEDEAEFEFLKVCVCERATWVSLKELY